jgi:hypothetical protein
MVWDTSVAASMARSAMPGWGLGCGMSVLKFVVSKPDEEIRPAPLAIRASARFEQRARRPLAIRDRRRP